MESAQRWIEELKDLLIQRNGPEVLAHMMRIVPEYQPSDKWSAALSAGQTKARAAVGA
jgi:hypothetical protein